MVTWHFCFWYGNKFNWSLQVVGYCFQDIKEKEKISFLNCFVSAVAVYSFIWLHSFQFDIFKGKRHENCSSVLWRLRGAKLKCNWIKSDFQLIRKCFLSIGEVVLFCRKGKKIFLFLSIFGEVLLFGKRVNLRLV